MREPWFGAKPYGIGIAPRNSAGWIAVAIYSLAMLAVGLVGQRLELSQLAIRIAMGVLTAAFLILAIVKSTHEPLRWRWKR